MGYLAETYTLFELAKRKVYGIRLSEHYNYDILCDNNCKIEVKSSTIRNSHLYIGLKPNQVKSSDFTVVCGVYSVEEIVTYIVPSEVWRNISSERKKHISIQRQSSYYTFREKWEYITHYPNGVPRKDWLNARNLLPSGVKQEKLSQRGQKSL